MKKYMIFAFFIFAFIFTHLAISQLRHDGQEALITITPINGECVVPSKSPIIQSDSLLCKSGEFILIRDITDITSSPIRGFLHYVCAGSFGGKSMYCERRRY